MYLPGAASSLAPSSSSSLTCLKEMSQRFLCIALNEYIYMFTVHAVWLANAGCHNCLNHTTRRCGRDDRALHWGTGRTWRAVARLHSYTQQCRADCSKSQPAYMLRLKSGVLLRHLQLRHQWSWHTHARFRVLGPDTSVGDEF
jgi:hypothetical protein